MSFHPGGIYGGEMQGHLVSKQNMNHASILAAFREIKQWENEADHLGKSSGGISGSIKIEL